MRTVRPEGRMYRLICEGGCIVCGIVEEESWTARRPLIRLRCDEAVQLVIEVSGRVQPLFVALRSVEGEKTLTFHRWPYADERPDVILGRLHRLERLRRRGVRRLRLSQRWILLADDA